MADDSRLWVRQVGETDGGRSVVQVQGKPDAVQDLRRWIETTTQKRDFDVSLDQLDDQPPGLERAIQYAVYGICIDGEVHKQWCLERVLESLHVDLRELRVALNEQFPNECVNWESGVAP